MVSIGVFIKLLLLIPFVLCQNVVFKELTDLENKQRKDKCGNFPNFADGFLNYDNKFLLSFISPYHFITDFNILRDDYVRLDCELTDNIVTKHLAPGADFAAKIVGECKNSSVGVILGDAQLYKNKTSKEKWFCIKFGRTAEGELVKIIDATNVAQTGTAVTCPNKRKGFFCVKTYAGAQGHVISGSGGLYSLAGIITGPNGNSSEIMEVFSFRRYLDTICSTTGVCDVPTNNNGNQVSTTEATTEATTETTETSPIETTVSTTEITTEDSSKSTTQTSSSSPSSPSPSTSLSPSSSSSSSSPPAHSSSSSLEPPSTTPQIVPSSTNTPSKEISTTEDSSTEISSTESSASIIMSTSTDSSPEITTISEQQTIPANTPETDTTKLAETATSANTEIVEKPRSEALKSPNLADIDCDDDQLCFDEDIFGSSNSFNILLVLSISVFLLFF